jgi:CRP-like cAMP-binding protein
MGRGRVPFARVGADTNRAALACGALTVRGAVLVAMLRWPRVGASGDVLVSRPRAEVAEELGITTRAVSVAIRDLKERGAIEEVERGHNGRSAVYRVLLPCGCVGAPHRCTNGGE